MKKVSVQFNLLVEADINHSEIEDAIVSSLSDIKQFAAVTSFEGKNIEVKGE